MYMMRMPFTPKWLKPKVLNLKPFSLAPLLYLDILCKGGEQLKCDFAELSQVLAHWLVFT